MHRALLFLLVLASASMAAGPLHGQTVQGVVLDDASDAPVGAAVVLLLDSLGAAVASAQTDEGGHFRMDIPGPGSFSVRAEHIGYSTATSPAFEVQGSPVVEVDFRLATRAINLPPVVVRMDGRDIRLERAGFYDRREMSIGRFITGEEIRARSPFVVSDMLRMEPSVQHLWDPANSRWMIIFRGAARMSFSSREPCYPLVVLDGTRLSGPISVDDLVHPEDLAGIELFPSGHGAPPRFTGLGAPCGIILFWTRR